jgi:hypothetical protein
MIITMEMKPFKSFLGGWRVGGQKDQLDENRGC